MKMIFFYKFLIGFLFHLRKYKIYKKSEIQKLIFVFMVNIEIIQNDRN